MIVAIFVIQYMTFSKRIVFVDIVKVITNHDANEVDKFNYPGRNMRIRRNVRYFSVLNYKSVLFV